MSTNKDIRFARNKVIANNFNTAMIFLDGFEFSRGESCIASYYTNEEHTEVDTIFAIGIENGIGRDCYKVLNPMRTTLVWDINFEEEGPNCITDLINGEVGLWVTDGKTYFVTSKGDGEREIDFENPVPSGKPYSIFWNVKDNSLWISDDEGLVRNLNDTATQDWVENKLNAVYETINNLTVRVDNLWGSIFGESDIEERINNLEQDITDFESRITNIENNQAELNGINANNINTSVQYLGDVEDALPKVELLSSSSNSNLTLSFAFSNLKGKDGKDGKDGEPGEKGETGETGDKGESTRTFLIYLNNDGTTPDTPIGGTWDREINKLTNIPGGWELESDIEYGEVTWMSSGTFSSENNGAQLGTWSKPTKITGNRGSTTRIFLLYANTIAEGDIPELPETTWTWNVEENCLSKPLNSTSSWTEQNTYDSAKPVAWMCSGIFSSSDGKLIGSWSGPMRLSGIDGKNGVDSEYVEYIYTWTESVNIKPELPTLYSNSKPTQEIENLFENVENAPIVNNLKSYTYGNTIWYDNAVEAFEPGITVWVAFRTKEKGSDEWATYGGPMIWAHWGADGIDGDGIEYIFYQSKSETAVPPLPIVSLLTDSEKELYTTDDFYPSSSWFSATGNTPIAKLITLDIYTNLGWTDNPSGVSLEYPFEWVSIRKSTDGAFGEFCTPKIWARYSSDPVIIDLSNQNESIGVGPDRILDDGVSVTLNTEVHVYYGHSELNTNVYNILVEDEDGNQISNAYDESTKTVSITITGPIDFTQPKEYKITAAEQGGSLYGSFSRSAILTVTGVADGKDGETYRLIPSSGSIVKDPNSNTISPNTLTCTSYCSLQGYSIFYGFDDEEKKSYTTGYNVLTEEDEENNLKVLSAGCVKFYLAKSATSEPIDIESIPILREGKNGLDGQPGTSGSNGESVYRLDLTNENASINADSEGNILSGAIRPTCTARLYYGKNLVSNAVYSISPSVLGVSIDSASGVITFTSDFSFSGTSVEITVIAKEGEVIRGTTVMTVSKNIAGKNGSNGENGNTPTIGDDGHWYIGGEDTGKTAVPSNGIGIDSVTEYYAINNSNSVAPGDSEFNTTFVSPTADNKYLWNYELITYTDTTTAKTTKALIGMYSKDGNDGKGISSITEYYAISASNTSAPGDSDFGTSFVSPTEEKPYLWNYEVITYTDGTSDKTNKAIIGVRGSDGEDGNTPTIGDNGHWWIGGSDTGQIAVPANGVGIASVTEMYAISNSNTNAPENSEFGTTFNSPTKERPYLWNYELITYTDSSTANTTAAIIGMYAEDGKEGAQGKGIKSITEYYAISDSSTVAPEDSEFSTTFTSPTSEKPYLWNYEIITYTDDTTSDPTPKAMIGARGEDGNDGEDAVSYWLDLSADSIHVSSDNTTAPDKITATAYKQVGGNTPVSASECVIKYGYNTTTPDTTYSSEITVDNTKDYISFALYLGEIRVDHETVPILRDGSNGDAGVSTTMTTEYMYARYQDSWGPYQSVTILASTINLDTPTIRFISDTETNTTHDVIAESTRETVDADHCILVEIRRNVTAYSDDSPVLKTSWSQPIIIGRQFDSNDWKSKINDEINTSINTADSALRTYLDGTLTDNIKSAAFSDYQTDADGKYASITSVAANITYLRDSDGYLYEELDRENNPGVYTSTSYTTVESYKEGKKTTDLSLLVPISSELSSIRQYVSDEVAGVDIVSKVQGEDGSDIVAAIFEEANKDGSSITLSADQIRLDGKTLTTELESNYVKTATLEAELATIDNITTEELIADNGLEGDSRKAATLNAETFKLESGDNFLSLYVDPATRTIVGEDGDVEATNMPTLCMHYNGKDYILNPLMWISTNVSGTFNLITLPVVSFSGAANSSITLSSSDYTTFQNAAKLYLQEKQSDYTNLFYPYLPGDSRYNSVITRKNGELNKYITLYTSGVQNQRFNSTTSISTYQEHKFNGFMYSGVYKCNINSTNYSWKSDTTGKTLSNMNSSLITAAGTLDEASVAYVGTRSAWVITKLGYNSAYRETDIVRASFSLNFVEFIDVGTSANSGTRKLYVPFITVARFIERGDESGRYERIEELTKTDCYSISEIEKALEGNGVSIHNLSTYGNALNPMIDIQSFDTTSDLYKLYYYLVSNRTENHSTLNY